MDVHKLLGNVISSLSSENILSSWSVYSENNGYISVKIRYMEGPCEPNHDDRCKVGSKQTAAGQQREDPRCHNINSHFRRKSQRQFNRDKARHQQWKESKRPCSGVAAAERHLDQSDTAVSDNPRPAITSQPETTNQDNTDVSRVSPVVTRSMAKAMLVLDTPETVRHEHIDCSFMDSSALLCLDRTDMTLSPAEASVTGDPVSSDAEEDIIQDTDNNSVTRGDTDVVCDSGSHDVDHSLTNQDSTPPDAVKMTSEWKPPPGWCWACWYNDPEKCSKHS